MKEYPGLGVEGSEGGNIWRLGRASWATVPFMPSQTTIGTVLSKDGVMVTSFDFLDILRQGAVEAVGSLREDGIGLEILSGDKKSAVSHIAALLRVHAFSAGVLPIDKVKRLYHLKSTGAKAHMVGDGINDAPAIMAAHVSMAPATAADIGRSAADFVFLRDSLNAVPLALKVARHAERLVKQNFTLAIGYNLIAVPIAIMGHVTPLLAAIAAGYWKCDEADSRRRMGTKGPWQQMENMEGGRSLMETLLYLMPIALLLGGLGLASTRPWTERPSGS